MARPLRVHVPNTLYHVTSRGNDKQPMFTDDDDHLKFLALLAKGLSRFGIRCSGYCLMWNHHHLLLTPGAVPVSRLMQQVGSNYAQWFNWRHHRCGHFVQGRFDARLVENSVYYLRVHRYVVRNPVVAGLVADPAQWRWSSYRATAGLAPVPAFLDVQALWRMFDPHSKRRAQQQFREFAASTADDEASFASLLVGSPDFTSRMGPELRPFQGDSELSYADRFATRPPLEVLLNQVPRGPAMEAAVRTAFLHYAYTLREIADFVGCHPGTVWVWVRRAARVTAARMAAVFE